MPNTAKIKSFQGRPPAWLFPGPNSNGLIPEICVRKRPANPRLPKYLQPRFLMAARIRHCVECQRCFTRYLIGSSPYHNGSYLVATPARSPEDYTLYCSCGRPSAITRWKGGDVKKCEVSKSIHSRGYGTADEITLLSDQPANPPAFDITKYLSGNR